nr:unnamed protein product [Callosobruchus analis]
MSRNRFEIILRMLHFSDNEQYPEGDRLFKVQSLVDSLNEKFKNNIMCDEHVCIDETMVPFRGRLKFRQYIKGKRHKFGIKLFKLCMSGGYLLHAKIYCGQDKVDGMSVATKVVLELLETNLDKGLTLYTDNWYTSMELATKLRARNTHLVGTVRKNRKGLPLDVVNAKLKRGEIFGQEKNGIVVFKWRDKRDVIMLSTKHTDEMVEIPSRDGARFKPKAVIDYNQAKSFIDLSDQMSSYSTSLRRSIKWFKKIAIELILGASVVNAHQLFKLYKDDASKISITTFKENLCMQLLNHGIADIDTVPVSKQHAYTSAEKRGRCKLCYQKNKEIHGREYAIRKTRQVNSRCDACADKPLLCLECFFATHNISAKK